ncbi:MAG: YdaU family protein [Rhodospirillaceae bacterium]|nr:YdaU family protein [Rhodospirillaceae bacterium]
MAELPQMPWFPRDYQADTRHLTLEEHGAYRMLLDLLWIGNCKGLPTDDKRLARMLGITERKWLTIKEAVLEFFDESGGSLFNSRVLKEWEFVSRKVEANRANAIKGGKARALKNKQTAPANGAAKGVPNPSETLLTQTHTHTHKNLTETEDDATPLPDEATPEVLDEIDLEIPESMRRESKPKATDLIAAFDKIRAEIYGENMARPWPNQSDHTTAQQWLDNGATVEMVEGVLRGAMAGMQGRNDDPPELLKFFQRSIAGAIKQSKQPMPEGFPERKGGRQGPVGLHADAETNRWDGLVAGYFKDGFWPGMVGPTPHEDGCEAPPELIEKYRPKEETNGL